MYGHYKGNGLPASKPKGIEHPFVRIILYLSELGCLEEGESVFPVSESTILFGRRE
jgi:hypothetical protein